MSEVSPIAYSLYIKTIKLYKKTLSGEEGREDLKKEIAILREQLAEKVKEFCVIEDEKGIIITDDNDIETYCEEYTPEDIERTFMVHCTDFFPKEHKILTIFDGNKKFAENITYNGISKKCEFLSHRHTAHFTLNSRVENTGDGRGNWDDSKFMIVEPLKSHISQFVSGINTSDCYTLGSVKLSEDAVIMVPKDSINEIPEEERKNYQIVRYSGNPKKCLENFLILNKYAVYDRDNNNPGHFHSLYKRAENELECRDAFINYIRDNTCLSREPCDLSIEETFDIFKMYRENPRYQISTSSFNNYANEKNISEDFLNFFVSYGCIVKEDGNITFKNDTEVLKIFSEIYYIKQQEDSRYYDKILQENGIEIDEVKRLYNLYLEKECDNISANLDIEKFFREYEDKTDSLEIFERQYKEIMGYPVGSKRKDVHLNKEEIEICYKELYSRELDARRTRSLQRKISEFDLDDEYKIISDNITEGEYIEYSKMMNNAIKNINLKLQEQGIDSYQFLVGESDEDGKNYLIIHKLDWTEPKEILNDLESKNHFTKRDTYSQSPMVRTDFKMRQENETVSEYLDRLTNYTENFSKYYDGKKVDESIKFDENGDLIGEPTVSKDDFGKVAISKEAVAELKSGRTVREIREEMSQNKEKEGEEVGVDGQ